MVILSAGEKESLFSTSQGHPLPPQTSKQGVLIIFVLHTLYRCLVYAANETYGWKRIYHKHSSVTILLFDTKQAKCGHVTY